MITDPDEPGYRYPEEGERLWHVPTQNWVVVDEDGASFAALDEVPARREHDGVRTILKLRSLIEMDCYDAIEAVAQRPDWPARLLAKTARRVADLWNDPPLSGLQRERVCEVFPELADALDELLGGGPSSR